MDQAANYLATLGTCLVVIAYFPQITHLIKEHCSYGISLRAWYFWLLASVLILPHAYLSQSMIFVILIAVQLFAGALILVFASRYRKNVCEIHKI